MRRIETDHHATKADEEFLVEDIKYFEARLQEMGYDGDCAYERALAQSFERRVIEQKGALANLRSCQ